VLAGTWSSTSAPALGSLHTTSLPPMALARSRMPANPKCLRAPAPTEPLDQCLCHHPAHTQPELLMVVPDFDLNLPCLGMSKRIPQRFGSNLVHFVAKDGVQIPRHTLRCHTECRSLSGRVGQQAQHADRKEGQASFHLQTRTSLRAILSVAIHLSGARKGT